MKKTNFLISGLLVLGAAGAVSYAVSQSLPRFAEAAEGEGETEVTPTYTLGFSTTNDISMSGKTYLSTNPIDVINIPMADQGDNGIDLDKASELNIVITKDGQPYETVAMSSDQVYKNTKYTSAFCVKLTKPITEAGEYKVDVPRAVVYCEGFGENGAFKNYNSAFSFSFTMKSAVAYTYAPANGSLLPGDLNTVTVTYPEGAKITVNSGAKITLNQFLNGNTTEGGAYTAVANDNVVTLTLSDGAVEIKAGDITKFYYSIDVPENAWTIEYNGETDGNPAYTIGQWHPEAFVASYFTTRPVYGADKTANAADFGTLKIQYPEALTVSPTSLPTLKCSDGGSARTLIQYVNPQTNTTGKVVSYEAKAYAGNSTAPCDPSYIINGTYYYEIPAKTFTVGGNSNAVTKLEPVNIVNGAESVKLWGYGCIPKPNSRQASTQSVTLKYVYKVKVANPDAEIKLKRDGEVIATVKASETTTSNAAADKAGSQTVAYKFFTSQEKTPGKYTVEVPEGAFVTIFNPDVKNRAESYDYYVLTNTPPFTVTPVQYNKENLQPLSEISQIEYIFEEGTKIVMNPDANPTGFATFGTLRADQPNSSPLESGIQNGVKIESTEIVDNKIVITLNKPCYQLQNEKYVLSSYINAGIYLITTPDGKTLPNNAMYGYFKITEMKAPIVTVGSTGPELTDNIALTVADLTGTNVNKAPKPIVMNFYQSCFGWNTTGDVINYAYLGDAEGKILKDEEGNPLVTFSGACPEDVKATYWGLFLTETEAAKVTPLLKKGEVSNFTIVMPENTINLGAKQGAGVNVMNPTPIVINIKLGIPSDLQEYVKFGTPADPTEFYKNQSFNGYGMNYVQWILGSKNISTDATCGQTIKLYYTAPEATERELLCELDPAKAGQIEFDSAAGAAEGDEDPIEFNSDNTVMLNFDAAISGYDGSDENATVSGRGNEKLMQTGKYEIEVGNGVFTLDGLAMNGFNTTYNYINEDKVDLSYEITPTPGSEIEGKIPQLTITFPGVANIYDISGNKCKLYNPEGTKMSFRSSYPSATGNTITWKFEDPKNKTVEWKPGTYTFKIVENAINVGLPQFTGDGYSTPGNWPAEAMEITYIVKEDSTVGVALIGIEAADNYTVYTLDGRVVLVKAAAEKLVDLENGIYLINGKKVIVRK
ncbi:MAG: hypothetical protein NC036_04115 [Muribaculaceae bacterium]|nr:hypothetical protein [Muribaculaceae bacterium]